MTDTMEAKPLTLRGAYDFSSDVFFALHNVWLVLKGIDIIIAERIEDIPCGRVKDDTEIIWALIETSINALHKIEVDQDKITQFLSGLTDVKESFGVQ